MYWYVCGKLYTVTNFRPILAINEVMLQNIYKK
jgi:hypothetical protein